MRFFNRRLPSYNPVQAATEDTRAQERSTETRTKVLNVGQIVVLLLIMLVAGTTDYITYITGACKNTISGQLTVFSQHVPWPVWILILGIAVYILKPWRIFAHEDEAGPSMAAADFAAQDQSETELRRARIQKFIGGYGLLGACGLLVILAAAGMAVTNAASSPVLANASCKGGSVVLFNSVVPVPGRHQSPPRVGPPTPAPTVVPTPSPSPSRSPSPSPSATPTPEVTPKPTPKSSTGGTQPVVTATPTPASSGSPPYLDLNAANASADDGGETDVLSVSSWTSSGTIDFYQSTNSSMASETLLGTCNLAGLNSCTFDATSSTAGTIYYQAEQSSVISNVVSIKWVPVPVVSLSAASASATVGGTDALTATGASSGGTISIYASTSSNMAGETVIGTCDPTAGQSSCTFDATSSSAGTIYYQAMQVNSENSNVVSIVWAN